MIMRHSKTLASLLMLTGCLLTACSHDQALYEPNEESKTTEQKELKPASAYPDFSTTATVKFQLKYGELGQHILLNIYTQDPLQFDETNAVTKVVGEAAYKIFTNDKGVFEGNVELPAGVSKVYVTTDALGVRRFAEVAITDGKAEADLTINGGSAASRNVTRAGSTHQIFNLGNVGNIKPLYAIVGWEGNAYGKIINDNGGLLSQGTFSAEDLRIIRPYLGDERTSTFSNSKHYATTELVNTTIAPTFVNEQGETVTTESAQIYVTYVGEMGAWFQDGLGYYYYKTGEAPATRSAAQSQLKHYILLPNSSMAADAPYLGETVGKASRGYYNYGEQNAPAWANERVQLLFENPETGEISTKFPPGYTIGFFLVAKGNYGNNNCQDATYKIKTDKLWYSNKEWNSDNKSHFSALGYKDKILYGVEDGENTSYNDLVFSVEADPTGAIKNESREDIEIVVPEEDATEYSQKTYAYEDIWPVGGDYDLNDVIVEHRRSVTFDCYNYVKEVVDSFMAVQPAGSAEYKDGFAIQIPENQRGNITLPANAIDETETHSIILFNSAQNVRNRWLVIKRTFTGKALTKVGLEVEDNNPFIIAQYSTDTDRTEIHLPKHQATSKALRSQIGSEDDAYYVNKDGLHPFAIMLPLGGNQPFHAVTERVQINVEYPDFTEWVNSNMTKKQNWYLNYQPRQ